MKTVTKSKTGNKVIRAVNKHLDYYLSLPYVVETSPIPEEEGGGYVACIPVLGRWSAVGDGETPSEAYSNLFASLRSLLADWIERGVPIPEPKQEEDLPSGVLSLRLPKSLHARILREKDVEGISINAYIVSVLEQATASASTLRFLEDQIERQVAMKLTTLSRSSMANKYRFEELRDEMSREALQRLVNQQMTERMSKKQTESVTVQFNLLQCANG